jgi:asparagine synthetase A
MNPYIQSFQQPQDTSGLSPVYQNMAAQQQFQNQAAQQGQQLTQQAGQTAQGGMNPLAMAALLRKKDPNKPDYDQWQTTGSNQYFGNNSNGMGAGEGYSGMNAELGL